MEQDQPCITKIPILTVITLIFLGVVFSMISKFKTLIRKIFN